MKTLAYSGAGFQWYQTHAPASGAGQEEEVSLMERVGAQIRQLRTARGQTLRELADLAGVSFQMLQKIEARGQNTGVDRVEAIARALGANVEFVLDCRGVPVHLGLEPGRQELVDRYTELVKAASPADLGRQARVAHTLDPGGMYPKHVHVLQPRCGRSSPGQQLCGTQTRDQRMGLLHRSCGEGV